MSDTITRQELKDKIDRGDRFQLVETLAEEYFRKHHLPGAINLPPDQVKQLGPQLLPDKEVEIVVYCANTQCMASENAAQELAQMGYRHVRRYVEGKQDWLDAGLPMERATPAQAAR